MILLNWTGNDEPRRIPAFERDSDGKGVWFWSVRWLGMEMVCYSKAMATQLIDRLNRVGDPAH